MRALGVFALLIGCGCATTDEVVDDGVPHPIDDHTSTSATPTADDLVKGTSTNISAAQGDDRAPSGEAYRAVLEAELRHLDGHPREALELLREAALYDAESPYLHIRTAELALEIGDLDRARASAERAVASSPDDVHARVILARALRSSGAHERARAVLKEALKRSPAHRPASTLLAEIDLVDGRVDDAVSTLSTLMDKEPVAIDGFLTLSSLFADRGDIDRAFVFVDKALARDPRAPDALTQKLTLLMAVGRYDDGVVVVDKLARELGDLRRTRHALLTTLLLANQTERARGLVDAWRSEDDGESMRSLLAHAFESAGQRDDAVDILLAKTPRGEPSHRLVVEAGRILLEDGQVSRAAKHLCDTEVPRHSEATWRAFVDTSCVRALLKSGNVDAAVTRLERARIQEPNAWRLLDVMSTLTRFAPDRLSPDEAEAAIGRARLARPDDIDLLEVELGFLRRAGRTTEARVILDGEVRARPDDPAMRMALARFLERAGDGRGAVSIGRDLLDRNVEPSTSLLNFVAFALADSRIDVDDAKAMAWRALVMDPVNGFITDTLGWAVFHAGDVEQASIILARADRLSPHEPEILFHRAEVARAMLQRDQAILLVKEAERFVDKDDDRLTTRLEQLKQRLGVS